MAVVSGYGGLNAKVRAMRGRLLKKEDYDALSQQKSVEEVAVKLREHKTYAACLGEVESLSMRRGIIEQKIIFSLVNDFSRMYNFIFSFDLKKFFDCFFLKNEISILKYILASIYDNRHVSYTMPELHTLIHDNLRIDLNRLIQSKTVPEFIENLKGTMFYELLSAKYDEKPSLFDLEMKLDIFYYMHLWQCQNKFLDKTNKKAMAQINGTEIDLKNILWIHRLKSYYNINDSEIYAYLIPVNYKLGKERLMRMVEAKTPEELWAEIKQSPYGGVFDEGKTIEAGLETAMDLAYQRSQTQYDDSLAHAIGYIHLKEREIKNITSLLEGVRYGLKQEEILKYVSVSR
ncbi:MAG: V-type ATPase subunit [Clostridiales bacterium]|jgi:V/A-type H+-transporting ATPase subunit C|nr:V-type ATPase subunit [Clostridiales bacterium]